MNVKDGPFWAVYENIGARWRPCFGTFGLTRAEAQRRFVNSSGVPGWRAAYAKGFRCLKVFVVPCAIVPEPMEG